MYKISAIRRICKVWPTTAEGYAVMGVAIIGTSLQFTLIATSGELPRNLVLLLPSSLPMWFVTVLSIRAVDEWRYGGLRDNWKEVKMFHAPPGPLVLLGTGDAYPRGPTMVVAPNRAGIEERGSWATLVPLLKRWRPKEASSRGGRLLAGYMGRVGSGSSSRLLRSSTWF